MNDDAELLRRYAETGADDAFATLVRRYLDLTWAAARRVTGDPDLAGDVAQSVFVDLARKARYLPRDVVLPAWLHRAAYLAACKVMRTNRRRVERETVAMNESPSHQSEGESSVASEDLLGRLDEALASLGRTDREAVLLRFFPNRTYAEVGARLGVNEEAARKRVARSLERLRSWFGRRGTATTASLVAAALVTASSQLAPSGLAASAVAASLAGVGTLGIIETLALMKTKLVLSAVAVAAVATPLTYQQLEIRQLENENRALHARVVSALDGAQPRIESTQQTIDAAELERLRKAQSELIRLRGEIGLLRANAARLAQLETELAQARAVRTDASQSNATTGVEPSPEAVEAQKAVAIAKLNTMKNWGIAMILYADQNHDQLPANLEAARKFLPQDFDPSGVDDANVELIAKGRLTELGNPTQTILAREREPWVSAQGRLARTYVFVDGHSEVFSPPNNDFTDWERQRGITGRP